MKFRYAVTIEKRVQLTSTLPNPYFIAYHPELLGCFGTGYTEEEARKDLFAVRKIMIKDMIRDRECIPKPTLRSN